jgi:hypothetical protein
MLTFDQMKMAAKLGLDLDAAEKDPRIVGGTQAIYCPVCGREIEPKDGYQLDLQGRRLHSPSCR